MSSDYVQLLDATLRHLEQLRSDGVEFVPVKASTLAALSAPVKPTAPARPAAPANRVNPPRAPVSSHPPVDRPAPHAAERPAFSGSFESAILPVETTPAPPAAAAMALDSTASTEPLPPRLERAAKEEAMKSLRERVLACVRCPNLVRSRRSVVFGVGDIHSRLMFVGEAPGTDEDQQGEPFVGAAGMKLTQIIKAMGLSRSEVFIANVLKCRPDTPGQATGNRKPTPEEMATCLPYLQEQIELIQPEVIVALGATAVEGLFAQKQVFITRARGRWQTFRGIPVMPTFHPSYILRNESPVVKRQVWEDMLAVMERLQMPISEKQRGYFKTTA